MDGPRPEKSSPERDGSDELAEEWRGRLPDLLHAAEDGEERRRLRSALRGLAAPDGE